MSCTTLRVRVCAFAATLVVTATAASAQVSFSATGNPSNLRFLAGPDFATDVLGDPWDFSNGEDLSPDPDELGGWSQTAAARLYGNAPAFLQAGVFRGTTSNNDPQLTVLYRGGYSLVNTDRTGIRYPIATAQYSKIAMRVSYGAAAPPGQAAVYWFFYPNGHPSTRFGGRFIGAADPGGRTHVLDLASVAPNDGSPWSAEALIRGLRIDPTSGGLGVDITIDWVRLTAPDATTTARMFVNVTCSGGWTVVATDAGGETPLHSGTGSGNGVAVNYGVLPPGNYGLGLRCNGTSVGSTTPFRINAPAIVKVTAPNALEGEDFAARTLANGAWDMAQDGDIAKLGHLADPSFQAVGGGREFRARNLADGSGVAGDPQVYLLAEPNNATPISTTRYRYLTYTLTVAGAFDPGEFTVTRVLWSSFPFSATGADTGSQDIKTWPGRVSYTIDLARLSATPDPIEGEGIETECYTLCQTTSWTARNARFLRIDPHEFPNSHYFQLGSVKLTAMPEVAVGQSFAIRFRNEDAIFEAGDFHTVQFYADTDTNPATRGTAISSPLTFNAPLAAGEPDRTFTWTVPAGFTPGSYYIYAEVRDANGEVRGGYSAVPVRVFVPPSSSVQINVTRPAAGTTNYVPLNIAGCAANQGASGSSGVDDILITATGGSDVTNPGQRGVTFTLGDAVATNPEFGTKQVGIACAGGDASSAADVAAAGVGFAASGFAVNNVYGLSAGPWTLRVLARDAADGSLAETTVPFVVQWTTGPPRNLRLASVSGNTVTIAWDPPAEGRPPFSYAIEVSASEAFQPLTTRIVVPPSVTSGSGALPNGVWYVRVVTLNEYGTAGGATAALSFSLPGGGAPTPPGPPTLSAAQASSNPISLTWTPGTGGPPASYTLHAGTAPGGSDLGVFPMGLATSISATAPIGMRLYVRVVAANGAGAATSNEVSFQLAAPAAPGAPTLNSATVSGRTVNLSWAPGSGAAPATYTVLARLSPGGPVAILLPLAATSLSVPAPPGTYYVSVTATNGAGTSSESNQITVIVP